MYSKRLTRAYQRLNQLLSEVDEKENELWQLDHEPTHDEIDTRQALLYLELDENLKHDFQFEYRNGRLKLTKAWGEDIPGGPKGMSFPVIQTDEPVSDLAINTTEIIELSTYWALKRNAARPRDLSRSVPDPVTVVVHINEQPVRALIDSGSLGDFMSSRWAGQLKVPLKQLAKPLNIQLALPGSITRANYSTTVKFRYQSVNETKHFDIINLQSYDLILGTPFLYQHRVSIGLNPTRVVIGSAQAQSIKGKNVKVLSSQVMEAYEEELEKVRKALLEYAKPICKSAIDLGLPPLWMINHRIPIIDPHKRYSWRAS